MFRSIIQSIKNVFILAKIKHIVETDEFTEEEKASMDPNNDPEYHKRHECNISKIDFCYIAEFIAAAGLYIIHCDGEATDIEKSTLNTFLTKNTYQPEKYLSFTSMEQLENRIKEICAYWRKRNDHIKSNILGMLIFVALADNKLDKREKDAFCWIASLLGFSEEEAMQMLEIYLRK